MNEPYSTDNPTIGQVRRATFRWAANLTEEWTGTMAELADNFRERGKRCRRKNEKPLESLDHFHDRRHGGCDDTDTEAPQAG